MISSRRSAISAASLLLWVVLAYVLVGCLAMPWMDSWCYFAPGILAHRPFSLTMPLLDGYRGADTTWAIHWPGAPLLYSCVGPLLRNWPLAYPCIFIALWLGLARATRAVMSRFTSQPVALWSVTAAILLDRGLLATAADRRPELLAALCVMGWLIMAARCEAKPRPTTANLGLLAFSSLAAALSHPVTMACMLGLLGLGGIGLLMRRLPVALVLAHGAGVLTGLAIFGGRLYLLPHAMEQFMDHATMNHSSGLHISPWLAVVRLYYPSPSGVITLGLAVVYAVVLLSRRGSFLPNVASITFFGLLGACHLFPNPYYLVTLMPLAGVFAVLACFDLAARCKVPVFIALLILVGGNAGYWAHRTLLFARLGCPNLSVDIARWYHSLPAGAHHILISDHLWEVGAMDANHDVAFVTPPYTVSPGVRLAYEKQVLAKLTAGDLVIVDLSAKDTPPQLQPWLAEKWPLVTKNERRLPSSSFWGYQFEVYRKP